MITNILIAACAIVSFAAFNNPQLFDRLQLNPFSVVHGRQQYRIFSHAFVHGSWMHLFVNMFVLWQFGGVVERDFNSLFGNKGFLYFLVLFTGGVAIAALPSLRKHRDNPGYNAVGASGAVSAVLFSFILLHPTDTLLLFLILPLPAVVLGVLYLWYEARMQNAGDNIAHDAHYWGAIFGFVVTIIFKPSLAIRFVNQIIQEVSVWF